MLEADASSEIDDRLGAMLGTSLPPAHAKLQQICREFADEVLIPSADLHDREESYPAKIVERLANLGLMGILAPKRFGGMEMDNLGLTIALEEINRGCASTGVTLSVHNSLLSSPLLHFGTSFQQIRYQLRDQRGFADPGCAGDSDSKRTGNRRQSSK